MRLDQTQSDAERLIKKYTFKVTEQTNGLPEQFIKHMPFNKNFNNSKSSPAKLWFAKLAKNSIEFESCSCFVAGKAKTDWIRKLEGAVTL